LIEISFKGLSTFLKISSLTASRESFTVSNFVNVFCMFSLYIVDEFERINVFAFVFILFISLIKSSSLEYKVGSPFAVIVI